jgi:DNA-binding MarR family transcriptional regulator
MPTDDAAFRDLLDALTDLRRFWERPDRKRWFLAELGAPVELALLRALAAVDRCCAPPDPAAASGSTEVSPATVGAVAEALAVGQSTASRLVDQAVRAGYLERHADAADRRRAGLELTDDGRVLLDRADAIRHRWLAAVTAEWGPGDAERLAGLLRRFLDDATRVEERWG